jgi:hypothetical protein
MSPPQSIFELFEAFAYLSALTAARDEPWAIQSKLLHMVLPAQRLGLHLSLFALDKVNPVVLFRAWIDKSPAPLCLSRPRPGISLR